MVGDRRPCRKTGISRHQRPPHGGVGTSHQISYGSEVAQLFRTGAPLVRCSFFVWAPLPPSDFVCVLVCLCVCAFGSCGFFRRRYTVRGARSTRASKRERCANNAAVLARPREDGNSAELEELGRTEEEKHRMSPWKVASAEARRTSSVSFRFGVAQGFRFIYLFALHSVLFLVSIRYKAERRARNPGCERHAKIRHQ